MNPDAGINFDQFCEVTLVLERTPEDEKAALAAAFKVFDKNGDGTVDRDELVKALKTKGGDMLTDDDVQYMFAQINGDGNVSYEGTAAQPLGQYRQKLSNGKRPGTRNGFIKSN